MAGPVGLAGSVKVTRATPSPSVRAEADRSSKVKRTGLFASGRPFGSVSRALSTCEWPAESSRETSSTSRVGARSIVTCVCTLAGACSVSPAKRSVSGCSPGAALAGSVAYAAPHSLVVAEAAASPSWNCTRRPPRGRPCSSVEQRLERDARAMDDCRMADIEQLGGAGTGVRLGGTVLRAGNHGGPALDHRGSRGRRYFLDRRRPLTCDAAHQDEQRQTPREQRANHVPPSRTPDSPEFGLWVGNESGPLRRLQTRN